MKPGCVTGWVLVSLTLAALPAPRCEQHAWVEEARALDLSEAEIAALADQGMVVTTHEYRQSFVPYLALMKSQIPAPVFITSDAILNGYHVLFEESVTRVERRRARHLTPLLDELWRQLQEARPPQASLRELDDDAWRRALVTIGTAAELLGGEATGADAETAALIDCEVRRVEEARTTTKSWWLGPPDRGFVALDYSRFRPRSFYAGDPVLERLFRATAWLQAIPFRLDRDSEFEAVRILADAYRRIPEESRTAMAGVDVAFDRLLGPPDDPTLAWVAARLEDASRQPGRSLASWRRWLEREIERHGLHPAINDQLRSPDFEGDSSAEPSVRLLPSRRTPDSVLLQQLADGPPPYPPRLDFMASGLHVCAALGSPLCRQTLSSEDAEIASLVERLAAAPAPEASAFERYLYTVQALLSPPDPRAPPFIRAPAWQAKSAQTLLAGWAQLRHTWQLQSKQATVVLGMTWGTPAGFVEPVPEFFERLVRLVATSRETFEAAGALGADADELRAMAALLERWDRQRWELSESERRILSRAAELADALERLRGRAQTDLTLRGRTDIPRATGRADLLRELADQIDEGGGLPDDPSLRRAAIYTHLELGPFWDRLDELCADLERLAAKQLAGEPLTAEDDKFFTGFGEALAFVMLYTGNSYMQTPADDAPRVADVFFNPNRNGYLEVGIGRPRRIVVLYPWGSSFVPAHGAVLPYLEVASPSRLTDSEWRARLDTADRPALPPWLADLGPQSEPPQLVSESRRPPTNRRTPPPRSPF